MSEVRLVFVGAIVLLAVATILFTQRDFAVRRTWPGLNVSAAEWIFAEEAKPVVTPSVTLENYRYVSFGNRINCNQKPLTEDAEDLLSISEVKGKRFAYSWYAASDAYLCAALTAMKLLKGLRVNTTTEYLVDYVLTFVPEDLNSKLSQNFLRLWLKEGGVLKTFDSLKHLIHDHYYKASLQKLRAFQLREYSRVVAMDADGMPLQDLDHLFRLKFPVGVHLASPQMYWAALLGPVEANNSGFKCDKDFTPVTNVLMVVDPVKELYSRAAAHFNTLRPNKKEMFDMDIVNAEFTCKDDMLILPKHYGTLNSEYSQKEKLWERVKECRNLSQVQYMHFSGGGKPWSHSGPTIKMFYQHHYDKDTRAIFKHWFYLAHTLCPQVVPALPRH